MGIFTISVLAKVNTPPDTIGNNTVNVAHNVTHVFTQANFTTETDPPYYDSDGDAPENVKILTLPTTGTLEYNSSAVTLNQELSYAGIGTSLFEYLAPSGTTTAYTDLFTFNISDVGTSTYSSQTGIFTFEVAAKVNQPPTIGDGSDTVVHAGTIVFASADFTTGTTPAYSDPEGDAANLLRIDSLPANGTLKVSGTPVSVNTIVTFANIAAGNFTYTADLTINSLRDVTFGYSIADVGSGQFAS